MFGKLRNMKTLLIDDDEFVRDSFKLMFESKGCVLVAVETAEEALELLETFVYDIVITDYKLPGMDGLELCKKIQETHPDAVKILITAFGTQALEEESGGVGVYEIIEKPITSEAFEASLSRLFDGAA